MDPRQRTRIVGQYAQLFAGNPDRMGTEDGGSVPTATPFSQLALWHLEGVIEPIGAYPLIPGHGVRWGCVDFDEGYEESWAHALDLHHVLAEFSIAGHIERSRSKGYHVWVFPQVGSFPDAVDPSLVRKALLAACQIVNAPTKEINPKQTELAPGQVGNYVRLPYPGGLNPGMLMPERVRIATRVTVSPAGEALTLPQWIDDAWGTRCPWANLQRLADLYVAPRVAISRPERDFRELDGPAEQRLRGKARLIYTHGPLHSNPDRSATLWKLACYLREDDLHTLDEAIQLVKQADARWGKFWSRNTGDQEVAHLVRKAWGYE